MVFTKQPVLIKNGKPAFEITGMKCLKCGAKSVDVNSAVIPENQFYGYCSCGNNCRFDIKVPTSAETLEQISDEIKNEKLESASVEQGNRHKGLDNRKDDVGDSK